MSEVTMKVTPEEREIILRIRKMVRQTVKSGTGAQASRSRSATTSHVPPAPLLPALAPPVPQNGWRDIPEVALASGSRVFRIVVGSPVKVKGFGRGGAAQAGWYVTRIQKRDGTTGDLDNINVEVNREGSHTRTVKATKIVYVRPTSKAGQCSKPRAAR